MSHFIPEATPETLQTIKAQVFLAETKELLGKQVGLQGVTLQYEIEEVAGRGNAPSHYVTASKDGKQIARTYIHPRHGDPSGVAYLLGCSLRVVRLAGK
jgi:hypothetical protein